MNNLMVMSKFLLGKLRRIYFMALPENKQDLKRSRRWYTVGDSANQTIAQLAGGTFIVTLMSYVGISDANIGILTSLASLAAVFQLMTMRFVNKLPKYKFYVCFTVLQKLVFSLIYFIPLFTLSNRAKMIWVVLGYFYAQICTQIGTPASQDWIASLVPSRLRGRYFAIKDSVAVFIVASVMLIAGIILDYFKNGHLTTGFVLIGIMIAILVIINLVAFSFMKEPRLSLTNEDGYEMHGTLAKRAKTLHKNDFNDSMMSELKFAFGNRYFRKALGLNCLWMTSFYIAAPFNSSYQIKELTLPYTFIMIIGFCSNLFRIYISPKVGRLADRFGMAKVFKYSLLGLLLNYFLTACSLPNNAYIMIPIAAFFSACGWSFIGIGLFGIQLEFLDEKKRMIQLSLISSISGVYGFLISYLGGRLLDYLQRNPLIIFQRELYAQQILNSIGVVLLLVTFSYTKLLIQGKSPKKQGR
ncbi:MFS transporter [Lachnoclostridium phytofermentans]|uniref:Major facilitator superfamily MFS_1 n=1 Tax=Lachnoclostridium phytofermentans (strain ATCC 700394 / DSM 18823 / ISDg) TaxID=357809 RepID=A9KT65_LACP7|nr:MFS transporter [Lachnoclostridium phytofermentans]ABX42276.1 major facilitator superfamily MFS_1 [Lachnoclostridium phytofermentans ISDg]